VNLLLEFGGNKFGRRLRRVVAADARLRVMLKLVKGNIDTLPVGQLDIPIAADKSGERYGLGRGKGCIPAGAMLHRLDGLAICILVFIRCPLADKLLAGLRILTLTELGEVLGGDCSGKAELRCKLALQFTLDYAALGPIVLFLRGEFLGVIVLDLTCGKRLGDSQHALYSRIRRTASGEFVRNEVQAYRRESRTRTDYG
jgi:hypothetical protein